jgi:general stress protein 26
MSHTPAELEAKFWKALKSDMTVMLGLDGVDGGHQRPMTALVEQEGSGPIWIFTAKDTELVQCLRGRMRATVSFADKGHQLFAWFDGMLKLDNDPAVIERLWNPFVAAWYEGKHDPKLALLRLEPGHAQIWLNGSSVAAGLKMMLGIDPKKDYQDKVAQVNLAS